MRKYLIFIIGFILITTLASCTIEEPETTNKNETPTEELVNLTIDELKQFNGKDGNMAYVAIDGYIYDVSDVWESGEHNGYMAGTDISNYINSAPHGKSVIEDLEKVGEISIE